jgi:hypothetical protein
VRDVFFGVTARDDVCDGLTCNLVQWDGRDRSVELALPANQGARHFRVFASRREEPLTRAEPAKAFGRRQRPLSDLRNLVREPAHTLLGHAGELHDVAGERLE